MGRSISSIVSSVLVDAHLEISESFSLLNVEIKTGIISAREEPCVICKKMLQQHAVKLEFVNDRDDRTVIGYVCCEHVDENNPNWIQIPIKMLIQRLRKTAVALGHKNPTEIPVRKKVEYDRCSGCDLAI